VEVADDERISTFCFTTRNDKHPSWAARRIEQLAVSSNGKLKMGYLAEQKDLRWACALVSNQMGDVACQRTFSCTSFSFSFPLGESCGVPDLVAFAQ
jgi:hypothetical protein